MSNRPARIAVIGTGYVGLTTGACFASLGHRVVCADIVPEKVEALSRGEVPILEAGLPELVRDGIDAGNLTFVLGAALAAADCEFAYLCVPTPQAPDGSADLSYIRAAAADIAPVLAPGSIVVNKSTVPVGSTRVVEDVLRRDDVQVVSNPEFLREGSAVHDFLHPDRVVIGAEDQASAVRVAALFEDLKAPVVVTDPASAETIKYASNAFLATKVSFVNAMANVCEAVGADVRDVLLGMGYDKRIGFEFMRPGPGYGGSCFLGDETVLVRRDRRVRLLSFVELFDEVDAVGASGWEVLSWRPGEPAPELLPAAVFTRRPYRGEVVRVRTKMGRRITVTVDHPFVVGDGTDGDVVRRRLAGELTTHDWLPVTQHFPMVPDPTDELRPIDALARAGISDEQVIVRLPEGRLPLARAAASKLPAGRRQQIRRSATLRLDELRQLGLSDDGCTIKTAKNGTELPTALRLDEALWRVIGLYLAEGWVTCDAGRQRIYWAFHPTKETELVDLVAGYWQGLGVKTTVRAAATCTQVCISSRILAALLTHSLRLGRNCYEKRLPDQIWSAPPGHKQALLRGLWDGDGSWSYVRSGPSVVLEYGTASSTLADGMLRLLGDLGVTARLRVGRTKKSTVDTSWISISGAEQVERCLWLFPLDEQWEIAESLFEPAKRIAPTGYRKLSKNASWVRVTQLDRWQHDGFVYSLKVPEAGTVVATNGLVVGQCFPKDTAALVRIAQDAGYDFGLLRGVVQVNEEQFERVVTKVERMAGGPLEGACVGVWGLTFKARTDDLRMSPALEVLRRLVGRGADVRAYDPTVAVPLDDPGLAPVLFCADPYAACEGAEVLVVLTEWEEFRRLDFSRVADLLRPPARVVDTRNLLDRSALLRRGFTYEGMGR